MNILVIGGAGFLGAHVVRRCLQDPGNRVTVLDSLKAELLATIEHLRPVIELFRALATQEFLGRR